MRVVLDPRQLLLRTEEQHERGGVDLYFVQRNAQAESIAAESQRIGFNFEEKQYEYLSKAGLILAKHLTIKPDAVEMRVLVRDAGSEALGSVTVPVGVLLIDAPGDVGTPAKLERPK